MDHEALHRRARQHGANRFILLLTHLVLRPFFRLYFRMERIGAEHIPAEGPVILAANHRSFLDPFVIACMTWRPMYFVAKQELFFNRWQGWILNQLGAFPVDRGHGDGDTIETAKAILARGDIVLIFPEGTRIRAGSLGRARRGVGRLALETGAPVVPVAVIGTEGIRRGWRIYPHRVRIRAGRAIQFPTVENASQQLASAVSERIWPCVMLQWEWLGGLPPIRRAAIVGAGSWGTSLAVALARAGFEVELGCRTQAQAAALSRTRVNEAYLPGVTLPDRIHLVKASALELGAHDLVCLAVPARSLPAVMAAHGERITRRAGVLVLSKGLVPPLGTLPSAFVAERCRARAIAVLGGPSHAADTVAGGASVVLGSLDEAFARQLADTLTLSGLDVLRTRDVSGIELAGCAKNVATLAAAAATGTGASSNVVGAAAGKLFTEVSSLAVQRGCSSETFLGLAGVGDLVATMTSPGSRNRRAGELLAQGVPAGDIAAALGQAAESVDAVPLLAGLARQAKLQTPALEALAELVEGRTTPEAWMTEVIEPASTKRRQTARAA